MSEPIQVDDLKAALFDLFDETFDNVHGYYLDPDNSLFTTLASVSAAEASIAVGGRCASLASQVKHIILYLDANEFWMRTGQSSRVDWDGNWRNKGTVDPAEWEELKQTLRTSYDRFKGLVQSSAGWSGAEELADLIGVVVHTAYHLGEIRQALCILKP